MAGIITTVAQARQHLKIQADFASSALPDFDDATAQYLLPIIGDDLYSQLETAHAGTPTEAETVLIDKCRAVIVPFAFREELITRHLDIGDTGVSTTEEHSDTKTTRRAHRWEYKELKEQLAKKGYAAQELLIVYLKANKATFTAWNTSPYNDPSEFAIIRDGSELRKVSGLLQPHRSYMLLRGIFNTIADSYLKPNISAEFYTALSARVVAGTTTANDDYILPLLRGACIRKALAMAATEMSIRFSETGFTIATKTIDEPDSESATASLALMQQFMKQQEDLARNLFEQAITYMNANASASVFAEYFASSLYTAPGGSNFIEQSRTGLFIMS